MLFRPENVAHMRERHAERAKRRNGKKQIRGGEYRSRDPDAGQHHPGFQGERPPGPRGRGRERQGRERDAESDARGEGGGAGALFARRVDVASAWTSTPPLERLAWNVVLVPARRERGAHQHEPSSHEPGFFARAVSSPAREIREST
jgi:hypothetical protein